MKRISEGAEAIIYETVFLGIPSIVKSREPKTYREKRLDIILRTQRTKKEAKILSILSECVSISVPRLLMVTKFDIYMSRANGKRLTELINLDNKNLNQILKKAGEYAAIMHKNGISHGDYTPANLVSCDNQLTIIDFGLSEITDSIEDNAMDIILMKRSISRTLYNSFLNGYKSYIQYPAVIERVKEIEKRGRYMERTLLSVTK